MRLSETAKIILERRYLRKKADGSRETIEELFYRVSNAVAAAEKMINPQLSSTQVNKIRDTFLQMLTSLDFLPNSPTLMNAGTKLGQLAACFVLPVEDSIEGIFNAVKEAALIQKSGGGTGFSFSRIRPKGAPVTSTGGIASGPLPFIKVFDSAAEAIRQGSARSGANIAVLRVDHPDIKEFISLKSKPGTLRNFNISVGLTKEFMEALENDGFYNLHFNGKVYNRFKAWDVFSLIVEHAWSNGEPGIIFLDRLNEGNPTPALGEIEATNPCAEQPLLPYEACNLGSINLSNMVRNGQVDWGHLAETVEWSVRFLDNVIEINKFPLKKITEMVQSNRKIGLGVMGWADMLFKLRLPYNSNQAVELAEKVMAFIQEKAHAVSSALAEKRGDFPNIDISVYRGQRRRNATCTTIAPTGTISMIAGTSPGIEPVFALVQTRRILDDYAVTQMNPVFEKYLTENFERTTRDRILQEVKRRGSLQQVEGVPEEMKRVFVTAWDISPEWHVRMQAAFQAHCDNAVSKTINLRPTATKEEVRKAFLMAYHLGCKGCTVYRAGTREEDVVVPGACCNCR
ncbi:adenosylcobalamin-dependent ribonucleoside-diphosphate reductase [Calderihabitans maritimus]|uniref:Vitamin B12-dependent ribonucleotide reductase n=1 Tax=Calderihabitans maritimus TaxID=1246530 RepID=A0A1Z5HPJ8_9FIRM|nr:adenosylcobalamin-dependent ribonucleoside-diphosphate reductase [Calderihabitans maritimus]GAW91456.1 ribonucleotide-diphosphate reductase subunit alpha [Calderihabitans maritimus]